MGISSPLGERRHPFYKRLEIKALVVAILENVARGAVQGAADGVKGRETDGLGFAGLEDREVGNRDSNAFAQFIERHLAARHHNIKIHDNHSANGC